MRNLFLLILTCISLLLYACKEVPGPTGPSGKDGKDGQLDKVIMIPFDFWGQLRLSSNQDNPESLSDIFYISHFNITDYPAVDSVIFQTLVTSNDSSKTITVELFDMTDSIPVKNSISISNHRENYYSASYYSRNESKNCYSEFPKKPINLCLRLRSPDSGKYDAWLEEAIIYLYRK